MLVVEWHQPDKQTKLR